MKNENQCFFSISLENGIIITGENPEQVKNFLADLDIICTDALKINDPIGWTGYVKTLRRYIDKAWNTIYTNLKNKELKQ